MTVDRDQARRIAEAYAHPPEDDDSDFEVLARGYCVLLAELEQAEQDIAIARGAEDAKAAIWIERADAAEARLAKVQADVSKHENARDGGDGSLYEHGDCAVCALFAAFEAEQ